VTPARSAPAAGPSDLRIWAGIWVIYVVWGSTYLAIAVAVETIPPFMMASVRFFLSGGILLAWTLLREGRGWRLPPRRELRDAAVTGTLLLGGGMGMVAVGEQTVPSGVTALMIAMMPVWLAVFGRVLLGERLPAVVAAGIALGFAGVVVLVSPGDASLADAEPIHILAVVLSPVSWALGSLYAARRAVRTERPLLATANQMLAGAVVLGALALVAGEPAAFDPAAVSPDSVAALLYLAFIGGLFAFTVYAWLLRVAPLPRVATYAYVNPIVAFVLGAILLGEPITMRTVVAGAVIVVAVALIVSARSRDRAPADSPADAMPVPGATAPGADGVARGTGGVALAASGSAHAPGRRPEHRSVMDGP
jgi:drug/metabolite transporter (DMT)-like permease